ncbi:MULTISPECIES: alpha/beta family hydrolase [unclassified Actinotalea]|uniref:alpha/beta hydrolase family protein n=1 Tax=unclassified Actinotalea TaxID=2638618 RepID=UPI0015F3C38A|nr:MULTISPECIES: alpha/beta family hydrolase [unclassified Actinotalea]
MTTSTPAGLLLTPGSGASRDHRTLLAVEAALAPFPVRRVDFPGRAAGRRGPERAPVAVAHVRAEADRFAADLGVDPGAIVLGGRSFGGRMCSMALAEGQPAAGLVLLSYPLHPPGAPERLRIAHLPHVGVPVLAVSGLKDPFGTPEELVRHLAAIPGPVTTIFVPGGHSPTDDAAVATAVAEWLQGLGAAVSPGAADPRAGGG